jgi:DNA-binding protein HU-beta
MATKVGKTDAVDYLRDKYGVSKSYANNAIDGIVDFMNKELKKGNTVWLPNLGSFTPQATKARKGRNPSSGESIDIPAGTRLSFKLASSLKAKLNPHLAKAKK